MSKISSRLGVKTLILSAISLGGGGVFNAPLNNKKQTLNNTKLGGIASIYNTT